MFALQTAGRLVPSLLFAACAATEGAPEVPDAPAPGEVEVLDTEEVSPAQCGRDEDCAPYAQCCLDVACVSGRCLPRYVADCCTAPGPCAVDLTLHTGTCAEVCVAGGCERSLDLPDVCGGLVWELPMTKDGVAGLAVFDEAPDRVTWHLSRLRPFDGQETLRLGDVLCPTYDAGPRGPGCESLGAGGAVRASFETPPFAVPEDAPTVLELLLFADLGGSGAGGVDRLDVLALPDAGAASVLWSTTPRPGEGGAVVRGSWTPILIDLSPQRGRNLRLRFSFDSLDGRDNDHEGVALARVRVRRVCQADREVPGALSACEEASIVEVHPLRDALSVKSPRLIRPEGHARPCIACGATRECPIGGGCDEVACESGRCVSATPPLEVCCESLPAWTSDPSFEAGALAGWEVEGPWAVSSLAAASGAGALHFGLPDGTGLAPPGESARGEALGPAMVIPERAPVWRFSLHLATEWDMSPSTDNPRGLDRLAAFAVLVDDPRVPAERFVVWDSDLIGGTTSGSWREIVVALDRFAGREVRLGWRFDTVDAEVNQPGHVYIDDVALATACPRCAPPAVGVGCEP